MKERGNLPDYRVVRSNRKTMSLEVGRDLEVVVRIPRRVTLAEVGRFVEAHREWLERNLERMEQRTEKRRGFTCGDGEELWVLGSPCRIAGWEGPGVRWNGEELLFPPEGERMVLLAEFLRETARRALAPRVELFGERMGRLPTRVKITSARTRWGSCSARGAICFSLRMACLPPELADYVVVHELAHLWEHNHSPRFYAVVAGILPDHRERSARLREWQARMPL